MALKLFEQTSQVVYTIGGTKEHVALTGERPQDGEVFGNFREKRCTNTPRSMIVLSDFKKQLCLRRVVSWSLNRVRIQLRKML